MKNIGIIGAGVAGLQLGLYLQQQGLNPTIYAERTAGELLGSPLPSLVLRHHHTRERERLLGVNHWDTAPSAQVRRFHVTILGEQPIYFAADTSDPSIVVDMRIYTGRMLEDFAMRGGKVVVGALDVAGLEELALKHDLVVVSTGRGGLGSLFPRIAEHSPFTTPQRRLMGGMFRGIAYPEPMAVDFTVSPGNGEIISVPIYSFEPGLTGIVVEAIPGGALEVMAQLPYDPRTRKFERTLLEILEAHAPILAKRVDPAKFELTRPLDLIQGAITPTVRRGYTQLNNGHYVVAVGDTHVLNDPVLGQGANMASYAAWQLGEAICAAERFDRQFCMAVEERIWSYVGALTNWNNAMLLPPADHVIEFFIAATQHQSVADAFVSYMNDPKQGWETFSHPDNTAAMLARHGWMGMPVTA